MKGKMVHVTIEAVPEPSGSLLQLTIQGRFDAQIIVS